MNTLDDILEAVQSLDTFDRRQLDARLADMKRSARKEGFDRRQQYVADALFEATHQRLPVQRLIDLGFIPFCDDLYAYLGDQIDSLQEGQIKALVVLCLQLLADHLRQRSKKPINVDISSMFRNKAYVYTAMELAFPGYWRARILYRLVPPAAA